MAEASSTAETSLLRFTAALFAAIADQLRARVVNPGPALEQPLLGVARGAEDEAIALHRGEQLAAVIDAEGSAHSHRDDHAPLTVHGQALSSNRWRWSRTFT